VRRGDELTLLPGFIEWCQAQITHFAESFRRQVYGPSEDPIVIRDSLTVVAFHNRKLMREVGLDFTFMMSTLLQPNFADPDVQPNPIIQDSAARSAKKQSDSRRKVEGDLA
jgi:hypothetical protein